MREPPHARTPPRCGVVEAQETQIEGCWSSSRIVVAHPWIDEDGARKDRQNIANGEPKDGFDCPGCARPDPDHRTTFEFCENGAKAVADEAMKANVSPEFLGTMSIQQLSAMSDYQLNRLGRISHPVFLAADSSHYRSISWDDAFAKIANALNATGRPDRSVFYTSGRTSNEAAFFTSFFVRAYGTNNLPDCSNMCHESVERAWLKPSALAREPSHSMISIMQM